MKSQKAKEFIEEVFDEYGSQREDVVIYCGGNYLHTTQRVFTAVELAEQELIEQYKKEVAELNEQIRELVATLELEVNLAQPRLKEKMIKKAIEAHKKSCSHYNKGKCYDRHPIYCHDDCVYIKDFIEKLNS